MAARVKVTMYPTAIRALAHDPACDKALTPAARAIAQLAQQNSPDGGPRRGFKETIRVGEAHDTPDGRSVPVITTDSFWHLVEFGSVNNPPYRPITRAAMTIARFVDARRPA